MTGRSCVKTAGDYSGDGACRDAAGAGCHLRGAALSPGYPSGRARHGAVIPGGHGHEHCRVRGT